MTIDEALELMGTLAAAYPRQELRDETLEVYARDLIDLDQKLAAEAVAHVLRSSRFFPTIAEIRDAAAELELDAPGPMEAWRQASQLDRTARHSLVQQARATVGDDYAWRTGDREQLRPAFLGAYRELRAAAISQLVAPAAQLGAAEPPPTLTSGE